MNDNRYLVTLQLKSDQNSLEDIKEFPGLKNVEIDENYGLINVSPKRNLYVIRVKGYLDPEQLMSKQPQVKGVSGDTRVVAMR